MIKKESVTLASLEELDIYTKYLASNLSRGVIIGISGELGSGKTTLVQYLGKNLGIADHITSPTYSIENRYFSPSGLIVHHLDLFRCNNSENVEFIFELLGDRNRLILIEWPERLAQILEKVHTNISFNIEKNGFRTIEIS